MLNAAKESGALMFKEGDFIEYVPTNEVSLFNNYCGYDLYWNETKSGINPHVYNFMAR